MNARTWHGAAALLMGLTAGAAALAAPADLILPPPGLYQIDTITTLAQLHGMVNQRTQTDGGSGEQRTDITWMGQDHVRKVEAGAPTLRCMASPRNAPTVPAAIMHSSCKDQREKVIGQTVVHTAQCPGGPTVITVRRIDDRHWAMETRLDLGSTPGQVNLRALAPALEHEARNGATAEARAKARAQLDTLPKLELDTNRARADLLRKAEEVLAKARTAQERHMAQTAIANMRLGGGTVGMKANIQERWTRIADSCSRSAASPPG